MHKAKLIFIGMICLIPMLFTIPAHAVNGGSDPDPVVGIINDNLPMDSDGIGDLSDSDTFTAANAQALSIDAEGATNATSADGNNVCFCGPSATHPPLIRVRTQYQVWTRDVSVTISPEVNVHLQATVTTEYFFWHGWPSGGFSGNHVAPFGVDICYAFKGGYAPGILWRGLKANISWEDNARFIGVEDIRSGDDGAGNCGHYTIPNSQREWFVMLQHPRWIADGWIMWALSGDQSFHWHTPRVDDSKWLSPAKDPIITTKTGKVWHNIYKTW